MKPLQKLYTLLMENYGPQGYWPLLSCVTPKNPNGLHLSAYQYPLNQEQVFQTLCGVCIGRGVNYHHKSEKILYYLRQLDENKLLDPHKLCQLEDIPDFLQKWPLKNLVFKSLKGISKLFITMDGKTPTRSEISESGSFGDVDF